MIIKCVTAIDHIAAASKDYAVIVTEYGGFDAVRTISDAYCDNDEVIALCNHASNSIVTMTMHMREKEAQQRDADALLGMLDNVDPNKVTGRILKLRLKMQGVVESDIREGYPKTRKGFLDKNDSSGKKWKKRYFVLLADRIRYFASEADANSQPDAPKGEIPLTNGTQLKAQTNSHKMAFQIVCPAYDGKHTRRKAVFDRTFTLCAQSHEDGKDWQACIKHNIELLVEADDDEEEEEEAGAGINEDMEEHEDADGSVIVGIGAAACASLVASTAAFFRSSSFAFDPPTAPRAASSSVLSAR